MNLYNVLLDNKIPFTLLETTDGENVIYYSSFTEHFFGVGEFNTKTNPVILEYTGDEGSQTVTTSVTLQDGTCYNGVQFKLVKQNNPGYSTVNFNLATDKEQVEFVTEQPEVIQEQAKPAEPPAFTQPEPDTKPVHKEITLKALREQYPSNLNLKSVYFDKVPFIVLEDNGTENTLYCNSFQDYLFNVGIFQTKTKELILEYATQDNEKYVTTDLTFEDGTQYRHVKFRVVVCENAQTPFSTVNFNTLGKKFYNEPPKLQPQTIQEEIVLPPQLAVEDSKVFEEAIKQKQAYEQATKKALQKEKQLQKEVEQAKKLKVMYENTELIQNQIDGYKQELLEEYLNTVKKQSELLQLKATQSIEKAEHIVHKNLLELFDQYKNKLTQVSQDDRAKQLDHVQKEINLHIENSKQEILKLVSEFTASGNSEINKTLQDKTRELESYYDKKILVELEAHKEKLFEEFKIVSNETIVATLDKKAKDTQEIFVNIFADREEKLAQSFQEKLAFAQEEIASLVSEFKNNDLPEITSNIEQLEERVRILVEAKEKAKISDFTDKQKEYVATTAQYWARRILDLGGGGGSVAVQYAKGGTMDGTLNVTGQILSGGKDIASYFATSVDIQTLTFNSNNYDLSISNGNTVNLGVLRDNLTEVANVSASWNTAYTNLVTNSASYLLSGTEVYLGNIPVVSGNWNSVYTTVCAFSASWEESADITNLQNSITNIANASGKWNSNYTTTNTNSAAWSNWSVVSGAYATTAFANSKFLPLSGGRVDGNVVINGSLTALGDTYFVNTVFTTTSAVSVINTGYGPALYVFQAAGPYDVASFYDGDGVEVLHVGNAQGGGNPLGKVGVNTSDPAVELTVRGSISASGSIVAAGYNDTNWNTAYTNLVNNSAAYLSGFDSSLLTVTSGKWDSNYTTTNANSAAWSNWSTVSANYALGSQYVKLSGDTMTGGLSSPSLSSAYLLLFNRDIGAAATNPKLFLNDQSGIGYPEMFTVQAADASDPLLRFKRTSSTGGNFVFMVRGAAGANQPWLAINDGTSSALWDKQLIIHSNGNVGINNTSPSTKLDVGGTITATGGNSNQWNSNWTTTNSNSGLWQSVYTTVSAFSASWEESADITALQNSITNIANASGKWNSNYTTTNTNSAAWNLAYSNVNSNSGNWILDGGNAKGANITIGTNDEYHVNIETNTTSRLIVLSSGEVGIGTAAPITRLHVEGNGSINSLLKVGTLEFQPYAVNNAWFADNAYCDGSNFVRRNDGYAGLFYFQGPEGQFRFADTNNAGTTFSPEIQVKFGRGGRFGVGSNIGYSIEDYTGAHFTIDADAITIIGNQADDTTGRLVVGQEQGGHVTAGNHRAQFVATGTQTPIVTIGGSGSIEIWKDNGPSKASAFGSATPGNSITDDFIFSKYDGGGWAETMRILNADGNVGINQQAPVAKLHVTGFSDDVSVPIQIIESTDSQAPLTFKVNSTNQAYAKGDGSGNLAFGAQNFIAFEAGGFGAVYEAIRIMPAGNVGIGTSAPDERLSVGGNITASGGISATQLLQGFGGFLITGPISGNNITTSFNQGSATGNISFAIGLGKAYGQRSFAQGNSTIASGTNSYAEGSATRSSGIQSHAEGTSTVASGTNSHSEGSGATASGQQSHAEGTNTTASGTASHAEGQSTQATGNRSHAEGTSSVAQGTNSHAEGDTTLASGNRSHTEGANTTASNDNSHAEGQLTLASGINSHTEGRSTVASGTQSHAEGLRSVAGPGGNTHAEGRDTIASGDGSHAEGDRTVASGLNAHSEGSNTLAQGNYSHAAGISAIAAHNNTWIWHGNNAVTGTISTTRTNQFMVSATGGAFFPGNVGIGTDNNDNALTVVGIISTNAHFTSREWATAYTNLITNSAAYLSGFDSSLLTVTSANWNSNYTTTNTNSAAWSNTYNLTASNFSISIPSNWAVNTAAGVVTCTLPASPSVGFTVSFLDAKKTWNTNNLTILRNGNPIESLAEDLVCDISGYSFTITYIDSTVGWRIA